MLTYILPLRADRPVGGELVRYIRDLAGEVEVLVIDGSPDHVFAHHADRWSGVAVHLRVDADLKCMANGKVAGVMTGLRVATHECVVIADDDVRYDMHGLRAIEAALLWADVVRPQNYFDPLPWHALVDTARMLLNRVTGGDWPGTLGVRRSILKKTDGYNGDVLFENLELVRTICAAGGTETQLLDLFVRRLPPTADHFWSQRIRQAYDEFARPIRLAIWSLILPASLLLVCTGNWRILSTALLVSIAVAEAGRSRAGGRHVFPVTASLVAPLWIAERGVCTWLALAYRIFGGGITYRGRIIARAATPTRVLRRRLRRCAAEKGQGMVAARAPAAVDTTEA